jgi:DNA-binding response OmpR family regulator
MTLRRQGYEVALAASGLTALAALADHRPDLVLLDLMMLALSGLDVCRTIRAHPEYRGTPVVVLTGRETDADRVAARDAGADAFLRKPFQPQQLVATVREFAHSHAAERSLVG